MQTIQNIFQPVMTVDRVEADEDGNRFRLKATGGGFLANLIGLGTKATVTADPSGFRIQKTTFGMDENVFVPRAHIAATVRIVAKPLELLVLGLVLLPFFGAGLVFFIIYLFSKKRITVGVASTAGTIESVKLKANDESLEDIRAGMKLVEGMLGNTDPAAGAVGSPDTSGGRAPAAPARNLFPPPPPPAADEAFVVACGSCGAQMNVPAAAAGKRVRCSSCREVFVADRGALPDGTGLELTEKTVECAVALRDDACRSGGRGHAVVVVGASVAGSGLVDLRAHPSAGRLVR